MYLYETQNTFLYVKKVNSKGMVKQLYFFH